MPFAVRVITHYQLNIPLPRIEKIYKTLPSVSYFNIAKK